MNATELKKMFTEHPKATGETYLQHLLFTARMGARFVGVAIVLVAHGLIPFVWVKTASNQIEKIYKIMKSRGPKTGTSTADEWYI